MPKYRTHLSSHISCSVKCSNIILSDLSFRYQSLSLSRLRSVWLDHYYISTVRNEVAKVVFTGVCLSTGGRGGWGGIPACLAGFQAHTQGGSLGGSGGGGGLQAHTQGGSWGRSGPGPQPWGKLRGIWSRSTAKGEVEGDLVQAHSQGGSWGGSGEGCLLGGGCLLWGLLPGGWMLPGGACSWGGGSETPPDPPCQQTATVADGTHPTGMHSCGLNIRKMKYKR